MILKNSHVQIYPSERKTQIKNRFTNLDARKKEKKKSDFINPKSAVFRK